MNKLLEWMVKATTEQKNKLALFADSSVASIRLAAKGYRKDGELDVSADYAARLEFASQRVGGELPALRREELCKTCAECPYQLKCNAVDVLPEQLG